MTIAPISALSAAVSPIAPVGGTGQAGAASGTGGGFLDAFTGAMDQLSAAHQRADDLALQAATGDLQAVQDYTIAATEAQLLTQLTVTIRDKAVEAFNEVMHMQV